MSAINTEPPYTILVVEDEPVIRMSAVEALTIAGYRVMQASNAEDAILALLNEPHVDLVLSDVQMPGAIGGLSLARWLRSNRPRVLVVLTSGIGAVEKYSDGKEIPFLLKPYRVDDLLTLTENALAQRRSAI